MKDIRIDQLFRIVQQEEPSNQGKLMIYFGYAYKVGKTYALLKKAHQLKEKGCNVLVASLDSQSAVNTLELVEGLNTIDHYDSDIDLNIDDLLNLKPDAVIIDHLAHNNSEGARHKKRYQDVYELLKNGIDVLTSVDLCEIESFSDIVSTIIDTETKQRIPDVVFDNANGVELIDIEPSELINRYEKMNPAKPHLTQSQLCALRELAYRRCAQRLSLIAEKSRNKDMLENTINEHILVCLSPESSNAKVIRSAARLANSHKANFTALFVETPAYDSFKDEDKKRLHEHMHLATRLGAKVKTVIGVDIAYQIGEFARLWGVTKIVIGSHRLFRNKYFIKPSISDKLVTLVNDCEILVIPNHDSSTIYHQLKNDKHDLLKISLTDFAKCSLVLIICSLIGILFMRLGFDKANIITLYVLGVLITSVITNNQMINLISSIVSVLVFNFLFTEPRFSLQAYEQGYPITFIIMFAAAFLTGSLASRIKNQAKLSTAVAYRTQVLFETNQKLQQCKNIEEITKVSVNQCMKLLNKDMIVYLAKDNQLLSPSFFTVDNRVDDTNLENMLRSEQEQKVVEWVYKNNEHAGAFTHTHSNAKGYYLAIRTTNKVYGVIGIVMNHKRLEHFEESILLSVLGEWALALENEYNRQEKQEALVMAKNEKLRANLLRAISHDLRTPLTSISGNASNLLSNESSFDQETKHNLYNDIYQDSMWLINLVENLLSVSRIEEGKLNLHLSEELIEDVIDEALNHINREHNDHTIHVINHDELLLVKMDARLIVQVIINLVDNAIKYTPKGSTIIIDTQKVNDQVQVSVMDNGPGIDDSMKEKVFDMFYSGANPIVDARRSLGLGLALCKSIITAHQGTITVLDNKPKGTIFRFYLPIAKVKVHE